ncbi:MAG TPA: hypothetical protein VGK67_13775, partial [Myxococcales bacterium]
EPVAANFLASAIPVPAGEHQVALTYSTPGLAMGAALALVAVALVVLAALRERRSGTKGTGAPIPAR